MVALGLFAVESGLRLHGDRVLDYLLQLLRSLPTASWVQNTLAAAKRGAKRERMCVCVLGGVVNNLRCVYYESYREGVRKYFSAEGLIVEQFCYKLGLILAQIAATNPHHSSKVRESDHLTVT